jgi:hypothetical protein
MKKSDSIIPAKLYRDQVVTVGDLAEFKEDLLLSLARLIQEGRAKPPKKWLKSAEVKSLLEISTGALHAMRANGTLPFTKIGNLIYYEQEEINRVLSGKKRHYEKGVLPPRN